MTFPSHNAFRDFDRSVRRETRYVRAPAQEAFLEAVIATSDARSEVMKSGHILWRAQLGHGWRKEHQDEESFEVPAPYPPARMKPISEMATDGRANPKGIACLYLATKQETAVLEVRPLIGSYVSVGQFKVHRDVRLVNCSGKLAGNLERYLRETLTPENVERIVWTDINEAFSEPVDRGDSSLDYVPTQIITEAFKLHGFDGIAYKSSYGEDGFNVALFDIEAADIINCGLHRIKDVSVLMNEEDNTYFIRKHYLNAVETGSAEPSGDISEPNLAASRPSE